MILTLEVIGEQAEDLGAGEPQGLQCHRRHDRPPARQRLGVSGSLCVGPPCADSLSERQVLRRRHQHQRRLHQFPRQSAVARPAASAARTATCSTSTPIRSRSRSKSDPAAARRNDPFANLKSGERQGVATVGPRRASRGTGGARCRPRTISTAQSRVSRGGAADDHKHSNGSARARWRNSQAAARAAAAPRANAIGSSGPPSPRAARRPAAGGSSRPGAHPRRATRH